MPTATRFGDLFDLTEAGASKAATSRWNTRPEPTAAQAAAGNYALGTVPLLGMVCKIENERGSIRRGRSPNGKAWESRMAAHYGYILRTKGADGDHVDVFVGPWPESPKVWVINQANEAGGFDEHKVMLGFVDQEHATQAYLGSYEPGWRIRIRSVVEATPEQLRQWLTYGDTRRELKPIDLFQQVQPQGEPMLDGAGRSSLRRVRWDSNAMPMGQSMDEVMYMLRQEDHGSGLLLDNVRMDEVHDGQSFQVLDAMVVEVGRLKPKMDSLLRIMASVGSSLKPVTYQLSEPMTRAGSVNVAAVFELSDGQTITIWFHNPDMTPAKLSPGDSLVSWQFWLNKLNITVVAAPESGHDLEIREVARRLMKLAEKNSDKFVKANAKRAAALEEITGLKTTLQERQTVLNGLNYQIEAAKLEKEQRDALANQAKAAEPEVGPATWDVPHDAVRAVQNLYRDCAQLAERIKALGVSYPEPAEFMDRINAGKQGGNSVADLKLFITERSFDLAQLRAGRIQARRILGQGAKKQAAVDSLEDQIFRAKVALSAGGFADQANLGYYLELLKQILTSGIDPGAPQPATPPADPVQGGGPAPTPEPTEPTEPAPVTPPAPTVESAEIKFLRAVAAGEHDALALGDMLDKIEASMKALTLDEVADAVASDAITHWAQLEEKAPV